MPEDARAKIKLSDGREVWRYVQVRYREVESGRWISAEVAEELLAGSLEPAVSLSDRKQDIQNLRLNLLEVQSQIALDKEGGSKATSAARLVLKILQELEDEQGDKSDLPWFILGRDLANEVLALVQEEQNARWDKQDG